MKLPSIFKKKEAGAPNGTQLFPVNNRGAATPTRLSNYISPVQLQRLKHDVAMWREAVSEAESAWFPHRVRMQRMYLDTKMNGHVYAAWERRKELSLLRDYEFADDKNVVSQELTQQFMNAQWFSDFQSYALDAKVFGYTNIELGDCINDNFPNISYTRRWNIRPDGITRADGENSGPLLTSFVYGTDGIPLTQDPEVRKFNIFVSTPTDTGVSKCGYGLYYIVGLYEILMRNILGYNADFVELYAQPYRIGRTSKTEESERAELENALRGMGSSGYAVLDSMDDTIEFLESKLSGTGWESYDNLEGRCIKFISKIILGHSDAMDSTPGKLGGGQNNNAKTGFGESPVEKAINSKQTADGRFLMTTINSELLPRLRDMGWNIPHNMKFRFRNDMEALESQRRENENNKEVANIAKVLADAGFAVDPKYVTNRTNIPVTPAIPTKEQIRITTDAPDAESLKEAEKVDEEPTTMAKDIQNKLNELYK